MKRHFFTLITCVFLYSCQSEPGITKEQFIGTWENLNISATLRVGDKDSAFVVKSGEWETKLGIKPIIAEFNEDGSFSSKYYAPDGTLVNQADGQWEVRNDSLALAYDGFNFVYKVTFSADSARFVSLLDFDQDGDDDDLYDSWQRKISGN